MKRISAKATVYLVDGSNFSRSFSGRAPGGPPDALEAEFLDWLDGVSRLDPLRASCFRVVFDGSYRAVRGGSNPAIDVYYSEHESADDFLLERSFFLKTEGVRCVIVSNDRGITDKAEAEGVQTMSCGTFYRLCCAELKNGYG
jgi:hypothetical protein